MIPPHLLHTFDLLLMMGLPSLVGPNLIGLGFFDLVRVALLLSFFAATEIRCVIVMAISTSTSSFHALDAFSPFGMVSFVDFALDEMLFDGEASGIAHLMAEGAIFGFRQRS